MDRDEILSTMIANDDFDGDFKFIFNDDVYSKINWSEEPKQSLRELYRERAQQLRDTYDYLILSYSGGSDSQEILGVFMEENIFIDEIQIVHHSKAINKLDRAFMMKDTALQMLLEYELTAVPQLRAFRERSPRTKINPIDVSDYLVTDVLDNHYSFFGLKKSAINATFLTQTVPHSRNFFQQHHNNKTLGDKKNACFIRGIEKPSLRYLDGRLRFMFTDVTMHTVRMIQMKNVDQIYTIENFFWTRDCPFIPVKQSHVIKQALENDAEFYAKFMRNQEVSSNHVRNNLSGQPPEQNFKREYNRYIYKHWHPGMFLAPKHSHDSPDLKLITVLSRENTIKDAMYEQNSYFHNKFKQIRKKRYFNMSITSTPYDLGPLDLRWDVNP